MTIESIREQVSRLRLGITPYSQVQTAYGTAYLGYPMDVAGNFWRVQARSNGREYTVHLHEGTWRVLHGPYQEEVAEPPKSVCGLAQKLLAAHTPGMVERWASTGNPWAASLAPQTKCNCDAVG